MYQSQSVCQFVPANVYMLTSHYVCSMGALVSASLTFSLLSVVCSLPDSPARTDQADHFQGNLHTHTHSNDNPLQWVFA